MFYSRLDFVIEWTSQTVCFHCQGCLVEWLPGDNPFEEHGYWYPDCVYVRYIKGPPFYHECLKYRKERPITMDTRDCCL
jgi:hypothetical protein